MCMISSSPTSINLTRRYRKQALKTPLALRANMATPKLLYFNLRGPAELIRLIFAYKGVEYTDDRKAVSNIKEALAGNPENDYSYSFIIIIVILIFLLLQIPHWGYYLCWNSRARFSVDVQTLLAS